MFKRKRLEPKWLGRDEQRRGAVLIPVSKGLMGAPAALWRVDPLATDPRIVKPRRAYTQALQSEGTKGDQEGREMMSQDSQRHKKAIIALSRA